MSTNYQSALKRINKAGTPDELRKLETSLARVYDAGQLPAPELLRLYDKIFQKLAEATI